MARRYTREELLALRESPLVKKPDNLPPLEEWMGPVPQRSNDSNRKDQDPSGTTRPPQPHQSSQSVSGSGNPPRMGSIGARHLPRTSSIDESFLGPPKTAFASATSRPSDKPDVSTNDSERPTKLDRFNLREKFYKDRPDSDGAERRDNKLANLTRSNFGTLNTSSSAAPGSASGGAGAGAGAGAGTATGRRFTRDETMEGWARGPKRFDDGTSTSTGDRRSTRRPDERWDRDGDRRAGTGTGTTDRPRRHDSWFHRDEDGEEEDRPAALRAREWRRGNAVPDKDWNRHGKERGDRDRDRGDGHRGDREHLSRHDVDPEWMDSSETFGGSAGFMGGHAPAAVAGGGGAREGVHTQEDFQRWKERMKAGGARAAESGVARDKEMERERQREQEREQAREAEEKKKVEGKDAHAKTPSSATATATGTGLFRDPLFGNMPLDPFFSKWGNEGATTADDATTQSHDTAAASSSTPAAAAQDNGNAGKTMKSKSSRFASIFKPPSEPGTASPGGSALPPSAAAIQAQHQAQALPKDPAFAGVGPGTPVMPSPIRPSQSGPVSGSGTPVTGTGMASGLGMGSGPQGPSVLSSIPTRTDADQEGFQRILQMLGGNRPKGGGGGAGEVMSPPQQQQLPGATAQPGGISRKPSLSQFELPGASGPSGPPQPQPQPPQGANPLQEQLQLRTLGGTPVPAAPSPAISASRDGGQGMPPMMPIGGRLGTPGPTHSHSHSHAATPSADTEMLLRMIQQTKLNASSPGPGPGQQVQHPQQQQQQGGFQGTSGRASMPPGSLPPATSLPPQIAQQLQAQAQAAKAQQQQQQGGKGLPIFFDDPAILAESRSEPPTAGTGTGTGMPPMRRRDTASTNASGVPGTPFFAGPPPPGMGYFDEQFGGPNSAPPGSAAPGSAAMLAAAAQRQQVVQREQREREALMQEQQRQIREAQAAQAQVQAQAQAGNGAPGPGGIQRPPGLEQIHPQPGGGWPANQVAGSAGLPHGSIGGTPISHSLPPHPHGTGSPGPGAGPGPGPQGIPGMPPGLLPGMLPPGLAQNPAAAARFLQLNMKGPAQFPQIPPPHAGSPAPHPPPPHPGMPLAGLPPNANPRVPGAGPGPGPAGPGAPPPPPGHIFPGPPLPPGMLPNMLPPGYLSAMNMGISSPPPGTGPGPAPAPGLAGNAGGAGVPPGLPGFNPAAMPPGMNMPPPPGFGMGPAGPAPGPNVLPPGHGGGLPEGMMPPFVGPQGGRGETGRFEGLFGPDGGQGQFR